MNKSWNIEDANSFPDFIIQTRPPLLVGVLTTPFAMHVHAFRHLVERWRIASGWLHPKEGCPPRWKRRIEYILAIERGDLGRRVHGHVLIWNSGAIQRQQLAQAWREVCGGRLKRGEPLIEPYQEETPGVRYALKTFQTADDFIFFSPRIVRAMTGL